LRAVNDQRIVPALAEHLFRSERPRSDRQQFHRFQLSDHANHLIADLGGCCRVRKPADDLRERDYPLHEFAVHIVFVFYVVPQTARVRARAHQRTPSVFAARAFSVVAVSRSVDAGNGRLRRLSSISPCKSLWITSGDGAYG
jgi:hypothetical protein